jgi:hypothetical protein
MALSTSTDSLAVGTSRTFNLSPGSALTLVAPPNVRATITETPNTVSASGVGGNAPRTHNLQLGQTVTYGPYPMGGTVVVANASNSGGAITWVRSDSIVAESASGAVSLVSGDGNILAISEVTDYVNLTATGTAFTGACEFAGYVCTVAAGNITIYDNTSAAGTVIVPTTALAVGAFPIFGAGTNGKMALTTGCHVVLSGAATVNVLVG